MKEIKGKGRRENERKGKGERGKGEAIKNMEIKETVTDRFPTDTTHTNRSRPHNICMKQGGGGEVVGANGKKQTSFKSKRRSPTASYKAK